MTAASGSSARRRLLLCSGSLATLCLAGCLDGDGSDERYRLEVTFADETDDAVAAIDAEPGHVPLSCEETGETVNVFQFAEDGDVVREAPPIDTLVEG